MEANPRIPLQDLPLEQFLAPSIFKTPRNHKRPLSPSRTTLFNPAKRRVLDAEGIPLSDSVKKPSPSRPVPFTLSNTHAMTPAMPSRLGNGLIRNLGSRQGTLSPLSSCPRSPSRELYPQPTIESSTDPQSRHYPGFDIFQDSQHPLGSSVSRVSSSSEGNTQTDRSDEDKENVPLRKKAKKPSSKRRLLSGWDGWDASFLSTPVQSSDAVHPERIPFSARQAIR